MEKTETIEGKFQAHGWDEIYEEVRRRCGDWEWLHTQCSVAIWASLRRRRLIYNVEFTALIADR